MAQAQIPKKIIGNWIDDLSKEWQYGFFETFAIKDNDFWDYESVSTKNNVVQINLRKGSRRETLNISVLSDKNTISLSENNDKPKLLRLNNQICTLYPFVDNTPFKNAGFKPDTVTITGYLRNFDKYIASKDNEVEGPFSVSVHDFIRHSDVDNFVDLDSFGRFKIRFPVLSTQEMYISWGRLNIVGVVEPGEELFLFTDMKNYIMPGGLNDHEGKEFNSRPKQVLFMGENARLHSELACYNPSLNDFDRNQVASRNPSDLEFQSAVDSNYKARMQHLENHLNSKPTLSRRFKEYQLSLEKYNMAFELLQYRFRKLSKPDFTFDKDYLAFVDSILDFKNEVQPVWGSILTTVLADYLGYHSMVASAVKDVNTGKLVPRGISVREGEILKALLDDNFFKKGEVDIVQRYVIELSKLSSEGVKDSAKRREMEQAAHNFKTIRQRADVKAGISLIGYELMRSKSLEHEIKVIDKFIKDQSLKQLLTAKLFYQDLEKSRMPLSQANNDELNKRISNPSLQQYVLNRNKEYRALENKEFQYAESLQNTDHLEGSQDADSVFRQLIAPYKGKVIYLDFWGTWCVPCVKQMPFVAEVKKELSDKDVVFMYLANNSPDKTWKNMIKQMELTGKNIVHYNLAPELQAMIEKKFSVNSFPTYMLINKNGVLVARKAPRPEEREELVQAILQLEKQP
jgi:thiol-disulfide isomerase/thioredoxin